MNDCSRWFNRWFYGVTDSARLEPEIEEVDRVHDTAVLACATADGEIAETELECVLGMAQASGVSAALLAEFETYDGSGDIKAREIALMFPDVHPYALDP